MRRRLSILAVVLSLQTIPLASQETVQGARTPEETERIHNELRALRDGLVKATNEGDMERLLAYLHPNVVVTWQNAEVSRGRDGVRSYLSRMMSGPNQVVRSFRTAPTVDELTILYGDNAGIVFGGSHDHFELTSGMNFDLDGRWSATVVKEGGRWLIANFHASTNLFDNPVLNLTKKSTVWFGVGGLAIGALLAAIGAAVLRRRSRPA